VLLQHGRNGDRPPAMARGRVHDRDRGVDGAAEEDADLRAWLTAAVPAGVRRENCGGGPPVEPARARRR